VNPHVNAIAGRLSLRAPQRRSLEILDRITEIVPPRKDTDLAAALDVIRSKYPSVTDFEREFPSLCFALATGVGKTRLMGAFISYLHLAHGIGNFFVMAPNLTIYRKLIADFTPNTPKYVFRGIAEFASHPPDVITGDDYEGRASTLFDPLARCKVNIFNISKINTEVRGGRSPRIKRLSEYIGESYFEYLAALPDLVLLMDESHRYRASAGVRAINELKPILGLELTATPFVEARGAPVRFHNVVYDYPLGLAIADGFVKEPAVVTRRDFNAAGIAGDALERLKLEDGIRLHETVKAELESYARSAERDVVKPFLLVIARDTTHASELLGLVESNDFFDGRYRGRAIQVDSSRTGAEEEKMIERLLRVEHADEPTEIVIHVNMLKEGWDVTNLYTIIPLRAAHARVLIEQSIGRGLRLPYGALTGNALVDRLNIVAHDKFQEIVDEASRPESPIQLRTVLLDGERGTRAPVPVVARPLIEMQLGVPMRQTTSARDAAPAQPAAFETQEEQRVGRTAYAVIQRMAGSPGQLPSLSALATAETRALVAAEVREELRAVQTEIAGLVPEVNVEEIVARAAEIIAQQTIDIPQILVLPKGDARVVFERFDIETGALRYAPVSEELWIRHLRTTHAETLTVGQESATTPSAEDLIVAALAQYDDVSYDENAALLYDIASQAERHLRTTLSEEQARQVARFYQREIARNLHGQLQAHSRITAEGEEVVVSRGVSRLRELNFTVPPDATVLHYAQPPAERASIPKHLFGGFQRCLYAVQKFDSDPERRLAVVLERESTRWFRPARGQFHIVYRFNGQEAGYNPDFVAETGAEILMIEVKRGGDVNDTEVREKKRAAETWCSHASDWARGHDGKPWRYLLLHENAIADNMSLPALVAAGR